MCVPRAACGASRRSRCASLTLSGPGQQIPASHAPVIPRFLKSANSGASLVIFGDGEQTRDFVYVEDVVDALVSAATAPNVDRRVINVGAGEAISVKTLVAAIEKVINRRLEPIYNTGQASGAKHMQADLTRAKELLGYTPKTTLSEGLRLVLESDPRFVS
jgi:UDP-glucose 4-epimerase